MPSAVYLHDAELLTIVREIAEGDDGIYPADGEHYCRFCDGLESTHWHVDPAGNRREVRKIVHRGDCLWLRARQIIARLNGETDV